MSDDARWQSVGDRLSPTEPGNSKNRLSIECLPDDQVRWTMVRWIDDERESASGSTSLEQMLPTLAPYGPER